MVFGSVGPVFIFHQKKNYMIKYFFKPRLTGLGSFSVKNIYQNTFSMTTHCTPRYTFLLHTGCSGPLDPGLIKVWKLLVLCTFTVLLQSGPAVSVCVCVCEWVSESVWMWVLCFCHCHSHTRLQHCCKIQVPTPVCSHIPVHLTLCLAGTNLYFLIVYPSCKLGAGHYKYSFASAVPYHNWSRWPKDSLFRGPCNLVFEELGQELLKRKLTMVGTSLSSHPNCWLQRTGLSTLPSLCTRLTRPWYPMCQRKARMWYSWVHCTGMGESVARSIKNQRSSWIIMPQKEGWTTWTSWWLPTAAKGGPYAGHWWYSLTCWTSQRTTPEPRVEQPLSWGTGKGTGETSNPEKTTCSENPSLCSHHEEDSGGECWCPIHPT